MSRDAAPRAPIPASGPRERLVALDWMRGLVMVLMAVDHASEQFNAGRVFTDGAFLYHAGTHIPPAQFFTRWITHLCAPTFVFLAGTSMALGLRRRLAAGESAGSIDRYLLTRGLVIAGFEAVPTVFWMPPGSVLLQVLYAIGTSFLFMIPCRRLPTPAVLTLAVAITLLGEAMIGLSGWGPPSSTPLVAALLLVPGPHGHLMIAYPTLEWLAILLFGWSFGSFLATGPDASKTARRLAVAGVLLGSLFLVVRGLNGYGNMVLPRDDGSWVQWLHVSKYPPSLSFVTLELGIGAILLSAFTAFAALAARREAPRNGVLLVLGQVPMFFYLLHIPLLWLLGHMLGQEGKLGVGSAYFFGAVAVLVLYAPCRWYRTYKAAHPRSLAQYV